MINFKDADRFGFDSEDGELWIVRNMQRGSVFLNKEQAEWLKSELELFIESGVEEERLEGE